MQTIIDTNKPKKYANSGGGMPEDIVKEAVELAGQRKYVEGMDITEWEFQRWLVNFAQRNGWEYHHSYDDRKKAGRGGFPDFVLLRKDALIFAELKVGRYMPTELQRKWLNTINSFGKRRIYAVVWRPEDYYKIKSVLEL